MDHLKEALLKKMQHHKAKMGAHHELPEHMEAGLESDEDAHMKEEIGDHAPELSADQNDHLDEEAGEAAVHQDMGHKPLGYDEKAKIMESLSAHGDDRNPSSMHSRAAAHAKKDLHSMKGKKSY